MSSDELVDYLARELDRRGVEFTLRRRSRHETQVVYRGVSLTAIFKGDGNVRRRLAVEAKVADDSDLLAGGMLRLHVVSAVTDLTVSSLGDGEHLLTRWSQFQIVDVERDATGAARWVSDSVTTLGDLLAADEQSRSQRSVNADGHRAANRRTAGRRPAIVPDVDKLRARVPGNLPDSLRQIIANTRGEARDISVRALVNMPGKPARYSPIPQDLHPELALALSRNRQIRQLWAHQAAAWSAVQQGNDVVVVTPTASGKSLCFNLPVLDRCLKWPNARAVYFYPTKALANDQLTALSELLEGTEWPPSVRTFHGDLSQEERDAIRTAPPNILLATPDILHHQQLPKHQEWAAWWSSLQFVIVDEAHAYRGVFGSHIAHLIRRIRRVAALHGAQPTVIAASATIGNPVEHVQSLVGRTPVLIDEDGAPQVPRDVAIWEPLVYDGLGTPVAFGGSEREAGRLFVASILAGNSTIAFAKSRRSVERINRSSRRYLERIGRADLARSVAAYRSGYFRDRREAIERGLRTGSIKGVVATNALELGVDIGSLDVAILSTYPGSTMSFRQQAGRAGRRDRPALVVMIASQNPLDQYIASVPEALISAAPEHAATDMRNEQVAFGQLGCAAREEPLRTETDEDLYGPWLRSTAYEMSQSGALMRTGYGWSAGPRAAKPRDVALRSIEGRPFRLLADAKWIGDMDARVVPREAHVGAVYLHDGESYRVQSIENASRSIFLTASDDGVVTNPVAERYVDLLTMKNSREILGARIRLEIGRLKVSTRVTGYRELDEETGRPRGDVIEISPLRSDFDTIGLRFEPYAGIDVSAVHAVEHMLRSLAPISILCDRSDLDGHTDVNVIPAYAYIYDRYPGGVGLAERLYADVDSILHAVAERLDTCPCPDGCPACIQSGACLIENDVLDKALARDLVGSAA